MDLVAESAEQARGTETTAWTFTYPGMGDVERPEQGLLGSREPQGNVVTCYVEVSAPAGSFMVLVAGSGDC
jgi:hypothetical protein